MGTFTLNQDPLACLPSSQTVEQALAEAEGRADKLRTLARIVREIGAIGKVNTMRRGLGVGAQPNQPWQDLGGVDNTNIPHILELWAKAPTIYQLDRQWPVEAEHAIILGSTQPLVSLSAVTATGSGTAFNLGIPSNNWGIQITATGGPTNVTCQLKGSLDNGANFINIGNSIAATPSGALPLLVFILNSPCSMIRLDLTILTGGASPAVTGTVVGY